MKSRQPSQYGHIPRREAGDRRTRHQSIFGSPSHGQKGTEQEKMARLICLENGFDPDQCLSVRFYLVSEELCAGRCEKFLWEEFLTLADQYLKNRKRSH